MAGERRRTYELPPFLGTPRPVELVVRLERASVEGATALLGDSGPGEAATVRIDSCTDEIVRIRFARGPSVPEIATPMVVGSFGGAELDVAESKTELSLSTRALRVVVDRDPWRLRIEGPGGQPFFRARTVDLDAFRRAGDELWPEALQHVEERPLDPLTLRIYAPAGDARTTVHDRAAIEVAYRRGGGRLLVSVEGAPGAVHVETYGDGPLETVVERA